MVSLAVSVVVFVASHMGLSAGPVRRPMVAMAGPWPFRLVYSAVSLGSFVWMMKAYAAAPTVELWPAVAFTRWLAVVLMVPACILLAGAYTVRNPSAVGQDGRGLVGPVPGVLRVTRHPGLWAITLWALAHAAVNGDMASLLFFGGLGVLAVGGAAHLDARKRAEATPGWERVLAETSNMPFAAIVSRRARLAPADFGWWRIALGLAVWGVFLALHERLIGVAPLG